jgi:hypothetical protein
MKCKACGYWNRIEVKKLFIEQETSKPEVKAIIPMYEPIKTETCKKCGSLIAEQKEMIRIVKKCQNMTKRKLEETLLET